MIRWSALIATSMALTLATSGGHASAAGRQAMQEAGAAPATVAAQRAVVNRYCVTCHNQRLKTGGLELDTAFVNVQTVAKGGLVIDAELFRYLSK